MIPELIISAIIVYFIFCLLLIFKRSYTNQQIKFEIQKYKDAALRNEIERESINVSVLTFRNESELRAWKRRNCHLCLKHENESKSYITANCPPAFDIGTNVRLSTAMKIGYRRISNNQVKLNYRCNMFKSK